jgi:hypothetical protein
LENATNDPARNELNFGKTRTTFAPAVRIDLHVL